MSVNPRIVAASVVGLSMVGGAFVFGQLKEPEAADRSIATTVGLSPSRGFIPVADTDGDGLPDWQSSFNIPTIYLDDPSEETSTKTGTLAIELAARTASGTGNTAAILSDIGTSLTRDFVDKDYTIDDIRVSQDNSPAALKAYGNRVASITFEHSVPPGTESELTVLNRALLRNDATILSGLDPTIVSYERMMEAMLETSVPSSLTREHLALINVYQALMNDIKGFRGVFEDALPAMNRFRRYQADAEALYAALVMLYERLHKEGIQWNGNDPAARLIEIQ